MGFTPGAGPAHDDKHGLATRICSMNTDHLPLLLRPQYFALALSFIDCDT
jgi:hypothetical protein